VTAVQTTVPVWEICACEKHPAGAQRHSQAGLNIGEFPDAVGTPGPYRSAQRSAERGTKLCHTATTVLRPDWHRQNGHHDPRRERAPVLQLTRSTRRGVPGRGGLIRPGRGIRGPVNSRPHLNGKNHETRECDGSFTAQTLPAIRSRLSCDCTCDVGDRIRKKEVLGVVPRALAPCFPPPSLQLASPLTALTSGQDQTHAPCPSGGASCLRSLKAQAVHTQQGPPELAKAARSASQADRRFAAR
jgi:hypothetical protein